MGALTERLVEIAKAARAAGHGGKGDVYQAACSELGISKQTLLRKLQAVSAQPLRKRRSDSGMIVMPYAEAQLIGAVLAVGTRKNGKQIKTVEQAVIELRANGKIIAGRVDTDTGEIAPLSLSAVYRALWHYGVHPEQLARPTPAIAMATEHPNQLWQIDASLCVLYYLRRQTDAAANGLRVMGQSEFYKNKPGNLKAIENDRVWRYVVTDHASGAIYVEYVYGGESGENLSSIFINAMQRRGPHDPFCGVPFTAMLDPGSANTGALFKNLCMALGVHVQINAPKNPRAKGQVEQANNLIECQFESCLSLRAVHNLNELNTAAWLWMRWFNGHKAHSRHNQTRYAAWMLIPVDKLRLAPAVEVCRMLTNTKPEKRRVDGYLRVSYLGRFYSVKDVPGVEVKQQIDVALNPWRDDAAHVVVMGEHGKTVFYVVPEVTQNDMGFYSDSVDFGDYRAHKETPSERQRKDMDLLITGTENQQDAAKAKKRQATPFNGEIDPFKHMEAAQSPIYLQRGTALDVVAPTLEPLRMNAVQMAKWLAGMLGDDWQPAMLADLQRRFPVGATEPELEQVLADLRAGRTAGGQARLQSV